MPDDASLDDFLDTGDEERTDPDESEETTDAEDEAADDPELSTSAWSGESLPCADCGATVRRRWRDGDALVCADCKEW